MPRNTEGEFELVLGNKQLLSLFFLVVVLFAVFFSLGFMVGKSVSPGQTLAAQPSGTPPASSSPSAAPPLPEPGPSKEVPAPAPPPGERPGPAPAETQPARTEPVAVAQAPADRPAAAEAKPQANEPPASPDASAAVIAREMHLQIAAVHVKDDAEVLVENLRKKGYPVVLYPDPRDGWFRVLVGPFANERVAKEMKAMLEHDGYKSILKKP